MIIWRNGSAGEKCSQCGLSVFDKLCASSKNIRVCKECFTLLGPDDAIQYAILNAGGEPEKSEEIAVLAGKIVAELYEYGMVICHRQTICPSCSGSGVQAGYIHDGKHEKCATCAGEGTYDCKACGNTGISSTGTKCYACRK